MEVILKENTVNQIPKGTIIFRAREPITYICMVLKGRINVDGKGIRCILGSGSFLGIADTYLNRYLFTYEAIDDASVYVFTAKGIETAKSIINMNKDYRGIMTASLSRQTALFSEARNNLIQCAKSLYDFLIDAYDIYMNAGRELGIFVTPIPSLISLKEFEQANQIDQAKLMYYSECAKVPAEAQKAYFSPLIYVTAYHVEDMSGLISNIALECMEISGYIEDLVEYLMNNGETNLYKNVVMLLIELKRKKVSHDKLSNLPDSILDYINKADNVMEVYAGHLLNVSREKMEQLYMALLTGEEEHIKDTSEDEKKADDAAVIRKEAISLKNSFDQITKYAGLDEEQVKKLSLAVAYLKASNDRMSTDDKMRYVKKEIAVIFYKLYQMVFLRARSEPKIPTAVRLFLDYGFLDEELLDEEQLYELCSFKPDTTEGPCKVYTMCEWLEKIYQGKKDTSKNEFDEDYQTVLRNERKRNVITDIEEKALYQDNQKRLEFEINNMFRINNRLTNAQLSTFVPILYKEMFITSISKTKLTKQRINDAISKIIEIDYTAFHHEVLYVRPELKIVKEYIIKSIYPNIILTPTVGLFGSMWQEISNKRKDTPARFLFPTFLEGSLDDQMIRVCGRFRWEKCRSIQGAAWNNITDKSLTSEYSDYIQFYKKNHDLSEERKEKLKMQMQKARNNSREVFVMDYEMWIKGESSGAIRLNKIVREILATYCPFNRTIREKISSQPIFEEAMARYTREKLKKIREIELRYHALQKEGGQLTEELVDTLGIYRNM